MTATTMHPLIENVSRRGFLKGVSATAGLVLALQLVPLRSASAANAPYATGADQMPNGTVNDPHVFVSIAPDGNHPVQRAWREHNVPQCGYCQTGQIMQAAAFLAETKGPTDEQITEAMAGNICRCGCYQRIHAAVKAAGTGV